MAFTLPKTTDAAFPAVGGLGYVGAADDDNQIAMAAGMFTKRLVAGGKWLWTPVGASNPVPTVDVSGAPELLTSTPLAAGASFISPAIDCWAGVLVGQIAAAVHTDQVGTLYLEQSKDNAAWSEVANISAVVNDLTKLPWKAITYRYARLRYVNGATAQTLFRLWQRLRPDSVVSTEVTGSFLTMRTPVVGVKTVTATAAEIFAGSSRLAGRRRMILKNEDTVLRCRIGPSSVTQANGFPVEPQAVLILDFDPSVGVPIYAISEGENLTVAVMEI